MPQMPVHYKVDPIKFSQEEMVYENRREVG